MAEVGGGVEVEWTPVVLLVLMANFVFWPNSRALGGGGGTHQPQRKENILDLSKYQDKQIRVRFTGGREGNFLRFPSHSNL